MMIEAIRNFPKQFSFEPEVENSPVERRSKFLVAGMGGSNLVAGLLKIVNPTIDVVVHRDYGLPPLSDIKERLMIASSYSGNTEETIDAFHAARKMKLALAAIATGGKLLALAQEEKVPYVELPDTGIQPRMALGFNTASMLKIIGGERNLRDLKKLASVLDPALAEEKGKRLAKALLGAVPVIYASTRNEGIAYNWKIKFNETGKVPAFYNVFPELNHNEMTGFDVIKKTKPLSEKFHFVFLKDPADHPKVQKRMAVTEKLYRERGLPVIVLELEGASPWQKIFQSLLIADWTAYYLATGYGAEPEQVPMVEEFKKLIA